MAGAKDLRDAFNSVSLPRFICEIATLTYRQINGEEWQILTFRGTSSDGEPFEVDSSTDVKRGDNVNEHAKRIAQRLIDQGKSS